MEGVTEIILFINMQWEYRLEPSWDIICEYEIFAQNMHTHKWR